MLRIILTTVFTVVLIGCVASQPSGQLSSSAAEQQAKQFSASPEHASIYFLWAKDGLPAYSGMRIKANGEQVGDIIKGQFVQLKTGPGNYSFQVDQFTDALAEDPAFNKTLTNFDLKVSAGSFAIVQCWDVPPSTGNMFNPVYDDVFLTPQADCNKDNSYSQKSKNGISYCSKVGEITTAPRISGVYHVYEEGLNCSIKTDTSLIRNARMVKANIEIISNDGDSEYQLAKTTGTAVAYQRFLQEYPASKHASNAKVEYSRLLEADTSIALEQKIKAKLARDQVLPLGIKKDKYMLTLTKYLKNKRYEESLFYFELLDRLNVELSPSFDHFWGEALLRTNQPKAAIDKLYSYINKAGAQGKYYTQALELTNEAEVML
jgi:hypothetical protein